MLKGLKIMFVSCMAIGATAFAYQMINVQEISANVQEMSAEENTRKADVQTSATNGIEQLNNSQGDVQISKPEITTTTSKDIGVEKAKEIALKKIAGSFIKTVADDDDYHIYIQKDNYTYDVEVDRYIGVIDEVDKEIVKKSQSITEEKAKQLALAKVNGKIVDIKSDDDDYNIYIEKDNYIYEIEVDRYRGIVDDIDKERKPTPSTQKISIEKAKEIALTKVNGTIKEVDYDNDDNEYEITIIKDRVEYDIKIDAKSGGILEIEKDD